MNSIEYEFIETILNLFEHYGFQIGSDDKQLHNKIAVALSQYNENAEKWREHVAKTKAEDKK